MGKLIGKGKTTYKNSLIWSGVCFAFVFYTIVNELVENPFFENFSDDGISKFLLMFY